MESRPEERDRDQDSALELLREARSLLDQAIALEEAGRPHDASRLAPEIMGTVEGAKLLMESRE